MIVRVVAAIAAIGLLGAPAEAEDRRRIVGILDVRVEGVPKEIAAQFQSSLEAQLDSREYWLAPMARVHQLMEASTKWTLGCVVGPCLRDVKTQTGAELVVLAALTGAGTSFGYVVTLVRTDTGQMLSQEADRCDVCTVSEALTNATLAAVRLVTSAPEILPDLAAEQAAALAAADRSHGARHWSAKRRHQRRALVLTLAGVALAGAGAVWYFADDRPAYGLATAAAGGGMALGGVALLTF